MINSVTSRDGLVHGRGVRQIADDQFRRGPDMREVVRKAGAEVVKDANTLTGRGQRFDQVRADEPGAAGDETMVFPFG